MRLHVKADADKGHIVGDKLYGPGEILPGEFVEVPLGLENKLEPAPTTAAMKKQAELEEKAAKLRAEADKAENEAKDFAKNEAKAAKDRLAAEKVKADEAETKKVQAEVDAGAKKAQSDVDAPKAAPAHEAPRGRVG